MPMCLFQVKQKHIAACFEMRFSCFLGQGNSMPCQTDAYGGAGARQLFWGDVESSKAHFRELYIFLAEQIVFSKQNPQLLDSLPTQSRAAVLSVVASFLPYYNIPQVGLQQFSLKGESQLQMLHAISVYPTFLCSRHVMMSMCSSSGLSSSTAFSTSRAVCKYSKCTI